MTDNPDNIRLITTNIIDSSNNQIPNNNNTSIDSSNNQISNNNNTSIDSSNNQISNNDRNSNNNTSIDSSNNQISNNDRNSNNNTNSNIITNNINNSLNSKIGFKDVNKFIVSTYNPNNVNNSNILDIIGVYVKGQKILYTEAKTTCEQRLSFLMLPSIFFTVVCSISNLLLRDYKYNNLITSVLNGAIAFILAVINYLKLDARAEAHRGSAYKYDKLLSYIEFQSAKQLFLTESKNNMYDIVETIEKNISEIKETNQFVLPEIIRYNFPKLSNSNLFTEVKKIGTTEMLFINDLSNIMRDIYNEKEIIKKNNAEKKDTDQNIANLAILTSNYDNKIVEILKLKEAYTKLDKDIKEELDKYSARNKWRPRFLNWLKV